MLILFNTFSFNLKISRDNYRKHSRTAKFVTIKAHAFTNQCVNPYRTNVENRVSS